MSDVRGKLWQRLAEAARAYVATEDAVEAKLLSDAAKAWAAEPWKGAGSPQVGAPQVGGPVFPNYGKSKGLPVSGAAPGDLKFYASGCRRSLADPTKARFHDKERALLAAIEAEAQAQGVEM